MAENIPEIEHYYPLERIAFIASKLEGDGGNTVVLLNNFKEFYDNLDVKFPDVNNFRKNGRFMGKHQKPNTWRRKSRFKRKDLEKFLTHSYVKQIPENNIERIRRIIITNLNKLNEKKFTIIVKEFIDQLEGLVYFESYEILNQEISNKIHTDTYFIGLYAKLVKELIINKKWQKKMFNIVNNKDSQYYYSLNRMVQKDDEEYFGPFDSAEEAMDDAMESHNYKLSFCTFLEDNFKNRSAYQQEIENSEDNFEMNIYSKNRYNNFLKFLFSTFENGIFNEKVIHHILLQLVLEKEIEQFIFLFDIINKSAAHKFDKTNIQFYENKIVALLPQFRLTAKTKFKLQEYFKIEIKTSNSFDLLASLSSNENTEEKEHPKTTKEVDRNMNCIISEYPVNQDYENVKKMFSKVSNYSAFYNAIIQEILDVNDSKRNFLVDLLNKLWNDYGKFGEEFEAFIVKKLMSDFNNLESDYPNCRKIFHELILMWIEANSMDPSGINVFIKKLAGTCSEDDDEMYSIEQFNEKITQPICSLLVLV
jgi:hypothetical protein